MTKNNAKILARLTEYYISLYLYDSALFYAERLYYEESTPQNLYLLATCYYRVGKLNQTYLILHDSIWPENRYLFATVCVALGKLSQAEQALCSSNINIQPQDLQKDQISQIPGKSAGLYLLGCICRKENRIESAIEYFKLSLKVDPTCWGSVVSLSEMGVAIPLIELHGMDLSTAIETIDSATKNNFTSSYKSEAKHGSSNAENSLIQRSVHRKQWTENSVDLRYSPKTSVSLGMSSLSLRIPFISPGSMAVTYSTERERYAPETNPDSILQSPYNYPALTPYTAPRTPAFLAYEFDTPSLTPIGHGGGTDVGVPTANSHYEGMTHHPMTSRQHLDFTADSSICQSPDEKPRTYKLHNNNNTNTSSMISTNPPIPPPHTSRFCNTGSVMDKDRRVSFGPTTGRLSFSSYGGGELSTDNFPPPPYAATSRLGFEEDTFDQGNNNNEEEEGGEEEDISQPIKLARKGVSTHRPATTSHSSSKTPPPAGKPRTKTASAAVASTTSTVRPMTRSRLQPTAGGGGSDAKYQDDVVGNDAASSSTSSGSRVDRTAVRTTTTPAANHPPATESQSATKHQSAHNSSSRSKTGDSLAKLPGRQATSSSAVKALKSHPSTHTLPKPPQGHATTTQPDCNTGSGGMSSQHPAPQEDSLLALLTIFARAAQLLHSCNGDECISLLQCLPKNHFYSGYVQEMIGRALVEKSEYRLGIVALREMMRLEPFRMTGVETLSTALWHCKKEKELSALSQQVVEIDKFCPQTWCIVGNCMSLQRDHEIALKFFNRALQVDPYFAYAHTLSGHEHVLNEDLEKAATSFRAALKTDSRHFNAWYGLGTIYYRQERYELAEFHFRKAVTLNPKSSVLRCYLGMVLLARGEETHVQQAMRVLSAACIEDPKNPQLHFQRCHVLLALNDLPVAREALLQVKELAPKEPAVYCLLGQVCLRLGLRKEALDHLDQAVLMDDKEAATLKAAVMSSYQELAGGAGGRSEDDNDNHNNNLNYDDF